VDDTRAQSSALFGVDGPSSSLVSGASLLLPESESGTLVADFFEAFLLAFFLEDFFFFRGLPDVGAATSNAPSNGCGEGGTLLETVGVFATTLLSSLSLGAPDSTTSGAVDALTYKVVAAAVTGVVRGDADTTATGVPRNDLAKSAVVDDFGVVVLSTFSLFFFAGFFFEAPEASAVSLNAEAWRAQRKLHPIQRSQPYFSRYDSNRGFWYLT
jgi:hypothetical protein